MLLQHFKQIYSEVKAEISKESFKQSFTHLTQGVDARLNILYEPSSCMYAYCRMRTTDKLSNISNCCGCIYQQINT